MPRIPRKLCPLKFNNPCSGIDEECEKEQCAWFVYSPCKLDGNCAIATIGICIQKLAEKDNLK